MKQVPLLANYFMLISCLDYSSTLRWRRHVPSKHQLIFKRIHGIISQKIDLFITAAVRTSDAAVVLKNYWNCMLWQVFKGIHHNL